VAIINSFNGNGQVLRLARHFTISDVYAYKGNNQLLIWETNWQIMNKFKKFLKMKTRSSLKPTPLTVEPSSESDQEVLKESVIIDLKSDDSVVFTVVKEKRKLLMPEKDVAALMYAFGDNPEQESVHLMDELLQEYLIDWVANVDKICNRNPKTAHFLQAISDSPKQHYRAKELLALDKELKSARSVFDIQEMAKTQFQ
jgi:hypothetical protein